MLVRSDASEYRLDRQRNPEPPAQPSAPAPSLALYIVLLVIAFALLLFALRSRTQDWPSFCLNLGSNIIGAVIILVVVERRLRANELQAIRRVPETTRLRLAMALSPEVRQTVHYVRVLSAQMQAVAKPYRIPRPEIEAKMAAALGHGLILIGPPRSGKTTLMHRLICDQALQATRAPRHARIPVLVSGPRWTEGAAADVLLETMRGYYPVAVRTFRSLLRRGRLLCVFDSIDEAARPDERMAAVREFIRQYPGNAVAISGRAPFGRQLDGLDLERLEVPPLSGDEEAKLLELRSRAG